MQLFADLCLISLNFGVLNLQGAFRTELPCNEPTSKRGIGMKEKKSKSHESGVEESRVGGRRVGGRRVTSRGS